MEVLADSLDVVNGFQLNVPYHVHPAYYLVSEHHRREVRYVVITLRMIGPLSDARA